METKRQRQVAELVKRNFSIVLQSEGVNIYGAAPLVTVTEVKMSPDMGIAKIYLSIWNTENKQAVLLQMQEENTRLRQGLAQRLRRHVRRIPYIDFYEDETIDEMYRVDSLFDRLHEEKQMGKEGESTDPEE
jgi:ribosome-binding factor A